MQMFIAALLLIVKSQKQLTSPSTGVDKQLWYLQIIGCYSGIKRNELPSHEKTWMNCKYILLSERSQSEKNK